MRTKLDYELINKTRICKVLGFNVLRNSENLEARVELTISENGEVKILRFLNVSSIEFESQYSHHGNNLDKVNCADGGMEYVNLKVSDFIDGTGNFNFFANNLVET